MNENVLAFDFGASSGRAILGNFNGGILKLKQIHRFENIPIEKDHIYWDINNLFNQIKVALKLTNKKYSIKSIGIDTWGVDFGLIDSEGKLLENPVHYRDKRTEGMVEEVSKYISKEDLYKLTGNQIMNINTIFQLMYLYKNTDILNKAETMLLMPDLLNYLLTGIKKTESTIASTTQIFEPYNKDWNYKIINKLNFPKNIFTEIIKSGTQIGKLSDEIAKELNIPNIPVTSICSHDTASAVVSIPTQNKDFLFISSGTWSLIGTELDKPIINEKSAKYNITNESGINDTTRFLKNITGLWLIQETKRQFEREGKKYSFSELEELANNVAPFKCFIDPEYHEFQKPGNMPLKIKEYSKLTNQYIPETDGEIVRCIYESLALKYNCVFEEITEIVDKEYTEVNLVGGGIQAELLSQMIANASGLNVLSGPIEATAIGNIIVQLMSLNIIKDIEEARQIVRNSFETKKYEPQNHQIWKEQFKRYKEIINLMNNKEEL